MAQHIHIANFRQKSMRKIEDSIRNNGYFDGSLKYEKLPKEYNLTPDDRAYITSRAVPKSVCWFRPTFEVHTMPVVNSKRREVTHIFVII